MGQEERDSHVVSGCVFSGEFRDGLSAAVDGKTASPSASFLWKALYGCRTGSWMGMC